jgi:alpha-amylase
MNKIIVGLLTLALFAILSCSNSENFKILSNDPIYGPKLENRVSRDFKPTKKKIDWDKEIIYFLLVDRFYDGDSSNNTAGGKASHVPFIPEKNNIDALKSYQGGDLRGVIEKLAYIKELGATTIWLSPLYDNIDKEFLTWWPYHGYHPYDFYGVENHFGTMKDVKELVSKAHSMGLKVILDMIFNHAAYQHPWIKNKKYYNDLGFSKWFHPHSDVDGSTSISNWNNQDEVENKELFGLPDFNQDNPHVYDFFLDISKYWIKETGCDGFRLDGVKHINDGFWTKINRDIHEFAGKDFLMLGEVFEGKTSSVAKYSKTGFDALFDIPLYYTLRRVFAQGAPISLLSEQLAESKKVYPANLKLSTLIDNHDVIRFSYKAKKDSAKKIIMALTFINSLNGIPVIYYGTEVALEGGPEKDPKTGESTDYLNRLMMPWNRVNAQKNVKGIIHHMKKLFLARPKYKSLYKGDFLELYKSYTAYAFAKVSETDASISLFNNSDENIKISVPIRGNFVKNGTFLTSLFSEKKYEVKKERINIKLKPLSSDILLFGGQTNLTPKLDPLVKLTKVLSKNMKFVKFVLKSKKGEYKTVSIAGEFNGWNKNKDYLRYRTKTRRWEIELPLRHGRYSYKFVLNGKDWVFDPHSKIREKDPFGNFNSIVIIK